jgi:aminoglycoside phosphotransferase (APT) family kinase protein
MATLGDPLADVAWCMVYWGPTGDPVELMLPGSNVITMEPGFSSRAELVTRYEQRSGRTMRNFQFYYCLGVYKLAIILEGLYAGYLEGTAANARASEFEQQVPLLVARAHRVMQGEL